MRRLQSVFVVLGVLLAAALPLQQTHCAWLSLRTPSVVPHVEEHAMDDDDCCDDTASPSRPAAPSDPCCSACQQLPAAVVPPSVVLAAPDPESVLLAELPSSVVPHEFRDTFVGLAPEPPSSSPPHPSPSSQSTRSPPYSV